MTEVPEYLLERSREARARMTGQAPEGGGDAGASATPAVADAAAPVAAAAAPAAIEPAEPEPISPMVEAALNRKVIPFWVVPVLVFLPIWGLLYVGTLERAPREDPILAEGAEVYAGCAGCHGATGGGGSGRALNDGEVIKTFPEPEAQMWWVLNGSAPAGVPYGDPDREGGQRLSQSFGVMGGQVLSPAQLIEVVYYERITHGEQDPLELLWMVEWIESGELPDEFDMPADEADAVAYLHELSADFREEEEGGEEA